MGKMKKFTALFLTFAMALSLGACGNNGNGGTDANKGDSDVKSSPAADANKDEGKEEGSTEGDAATDQVANGEEVTVNILQYKVEIQEALQEAIDLYHEKYPNVTINLETVGGGDSVDTVYKSRAASGNMPDIFNAAGPESCETYMDYLEDLSDQPWVEHANSGMLNLDTIDGKVYGMPVTTEAMGLIANKAIFEAAGVDLSTVKDMASLEAAFKALQDKIDAGELKEQYPDLEAVTAVQGGATWVIGNHAINVALSPEFEEDIYKCAEAKEVKFSYKDAYTKYTDLMLNYSTSKDDHQSCLSIDYDKAVQEMLSLGKVAVIQQGNWVYTAVNDIDPEVAENLTLLPLPVAGYKEDCVFTIVSNYWCVNKQSDDNVKAAAKHFLNWLYQSEEGKDIVVNKFGFLPVFDNYGDLAPADPLSKDILNYTSNGKGISMVFQGAPGGEGYTMDVFGQAVQGYLQGTSSWDDVFKKAQDEWASRRAK